MGSSGEVPRETGEIEMTTTANKHGLRKAAQERTAKHAQRTELPPRAGVVAEARDLGVGQPTTDAGNPAYGQMTVAQLKAEGKRLGLLTYTLRTKGALLEAILKRSRDVADGRVIGTADAKVDAQMAQTNAEAEPAEAIQLDRGPVRCADCGEVEHEPTCRQQEGHQSTPSTAKANAFADEAERLGWSARLVYTTAIKDHVGVIATRNYGEPNAEVITIEWENGVFNNQTCYHTTPSRRQLKLRNASHAKKRMAMQPAEVAREDTKVGVHTTTRADRRSARSVGEEVSYSPYFTDESDDDVIALCLGKTITWINSVSGSPESDTVRRLGPTSTLRVKNHDVPGARTLEFLGASGYRSVRISAIVSL